LSPASERFFQEEPNIMRTTFPFMLLAITLGVVATATADPLDDITRTIEGKARRASSGLFDPESNRDAYHIGRGETVTLTTLDGPGEIRHMWFTIAGRDRRYRLRARFVTSWGYAILQASFNGRAIGPPIDTYSPKIDTKMVALGPIDVNAEQNVVRIEAVDRNPTSTGYYAGLDTLELIPPDGSGPMGLYFSS